MDWNWLFTNNPGDDLMPEWGDETRRAIEQIAGDIYAAPVNAGSPRRSIPIERMIPVGCGVVAAGSTTGVQISTGVEFASADEYIVDLTWQEDPGPTGGYLWVEKGTVNFTIKNSGDPGKKIAFTIRRVNA